MSMVHYLEMLGQEVRIEAFRRAIASLVRPGDVVLEVGSGLGTFAFFAADQGARKVYGVEGEPVVNVARTIARLNGYGDTVEFIRGWMPDVELPEPADLLIFEDFSPRLIDSHAFHLLEGLRATCLRPDFRICPQAAEVFLAPVCSESFRESVRLGGDGLERYGIDWRPVREYVVNTPLEFEVGRSELLSEPRLAGRVDFKDGITTRVLDPCEWVFGSRTTVDGFCYWFDLILDHSERLTNQPGSEPGSWNYLFLPLEEPLEVAPGEPLVIEVTVEELQDGSPGWLAWHVSCGDLHLRGHEFRSAPASLSDLVELSPENVPILSGQARREWQVLGLVDGRRSLSEIARCLVELDPGLDERAALRRVADILRERTESRTYW